MVTTEFKSPQNIIDNLQTAIMVIGHNLQIICINPAAEMLFHISNTRALDKSLHELVIDEHEFYDRLERSLVSDHPFRVYEVRLKLHNMSHIDVDYSVSPLEYENGGKYLLIEFDRQKNIQKYSMEENILHQYEASKGLLRGLAHEIKNPLGGIRGAAQLLERELNDESKQYTQIIIHETDRLRDLLDRMVGPKHIPNKSQINIHRLLEHVRHLVLAEHSDVTIKADYDPSMPEIMADESMMIQVILNLTRNAVTATRELPEEENIILFKTRAKRNCTIGSKTFALALKLDIIDNGPGIDEDLREKIFMPMVTGHADGTGLGLPIAQALVKEHDGLIEFYQRNRQTIFSIFLPITIHE
jgi:two-component system, NtrC family, nitrogen regulation sensor histidine kinase GlnL